MERMNGELLRKTIREKLIKTNWEVIGKIMKEKFNFFFNRFQKKKRKKSR